jgi:hypothetical protein
MKHIAEVTLEDEDTIINALPEIIGLKPSKETPRE